MQFRKFLTLSLVLCCVASAASFAVAQTQPAADGKQEKTDGKQEKKEKSDKKQPTFDIKNPNAEQLAEIVILSYGGRGALSNIRKTEVETGRASRSTNDGRADESTYERRIMRGETMEKDRVRIDQKNAQAQYSLIYDSAKTTGIINNTTFTPREEADRAFKAGIIHNLDALLRYKENNSTLNLVGKDKNMNVEYFKLDVTDKQGNVTRFNISAKLWRVLSLEYSESMSQGAQPVKFIRKFYDYRGAQGTLVPFRSVLYADGKQIEETNVMTITFGTKIDGGQFQTE